MHQDTIQFNYYLNTIIIRQSLQNRINLLLIYPLEIPGMKEQFKLHFHPYGKGPETAVAFHGFGQDGTYYNVFEEFLGEKYTLYSFDLPFHGKSLQDGYDKDIRQEDLKIFFSTFFEEKGIDRFTVIGYSIGAKFALNLLELFPGKVGKVWLIAPDGLKINFWYRLATGNPFFRKIFRITVDQPGFFLSLTDFIEKTGLLHSSVTRFAKSQMEDEEQRNLVYRSWIHFRKLNLNIRELGRKINDYQIPVRIFIGEKDRIIEEKAVRKLARLLTRVELVKLPAGHHRLIDDTAEYLIEEGF